MPLPQYDVHGAVFDANVCIDMARRLGEPVTWERFDAMGAQLWQKRQGHPLGRPFFDRGVDSLLSMWHAKGGMFAGKDPLRVFTSNHIDNLVIDKLQSVYGWSEDSAMDVVYDVVHELVFAQTSGATFGDQPNFSNFHPPLDWEDGRVYQLSCGVGDDCHRKYCITNDREFRLASLRGSAEVLYPHEWMYRVRQARAAFRPIRPPQ